MHADNAFVSAVAVVTLSMCATLNINHYKPSREAPAWGLRIQEHKLWVQLSPLENAPLHSPA